MASCRSRWRGELPVGSPAGRPTARRALAAYGERAGASVPVAVALHTDHCPPSHVAGFLDPLLSVSTAARRRPSRPLFASHMFDGSSLPLDENLATARVLLDRCPAAGVVLEVEVGVVGGEEDGITGALDERLYTTTGDLLRTPTARHGRARPLPARGDVRKRPRRCTPPGHVRLRPEILREGQTRSRSLTRRALRLRLPRLQRRRDEDLHRALAYGVVKVEPRQPRRSYAFTRAAAGHMFAEYDGVLMMTAPWPEAAFTTRAPGRETEAAIVTRGRACALRWIGGEDPSRPCDSRRSVRVMPPDSTIQIFVRGGRTPGPGEGIVRRALKRLASRWSAWPATRTSSSARPGPSSRRRPDRHPDAARPHDDWLRAARIRSADLEFGYSALAVPRGPLRTRPRRRRAEGVDYLLKDRVGDLSLFVDAVQRVARAVRLGPASWSECGRRRPATPLDDLTSRSAS